MPELPDVESFRCVLAEHAVGPRVREVVVHDAGVLRGVSGRGLREAVVGQRFTIPYRHGKWLVAPLDDGARLLIHFGMTGSLLWASTEESRHSHDRVVFTFTDGELRYRDMRKLKGIQLARNDNEVADVLARLGPDALSVSRSDLGEALSGTRRQVKVALTDQAVIAGLGNLLADEILWRARINPRRSCAELSKEDVTRLHRGLGAVLRQAVKDGRVPPRPSWLTGRRDDASGSCPRCGTVLARGRVNGRATVWCPHCQPD